MLSPSDTINCNYTSKLQLSNQSVYLDNIKAAQYDTPE